MLALASLVGMSTTGWLKASKQVVKFRPNLPARHTADIRARHKEDIPCQSRPPLAIALAGNSTNPAPRHGWPGLASQRNDQSFAGARPGEEDQDPGAPLDSPPGSPDLGDSVRSSPRCGHERLHG